MSRRDRRSKRGQPDDAPSTSTASRFIGTKSARHLRALRALLRGPVRRIDLDNVIGTTNAPHYVGELRELGLQVDCELVEVLDRDGRTCRPGVYRLASESRAKVLRWAALDPDAAAALA